MGVPHRKKPEKPTVGKAAKTALDGNTEGQCEAVDSEISQSVVSRVAELRRAVGEKRRRNVTMAVAVAESPTGERIVLVATSEKRDYLRKGVRLRVGETRILGMGEGHAEEKIVKYAKAMKLKIVDIGATNNVCKRVCQPILATTGAHISTPLE